MSDHEIELVGKTYPLQRVPGTALAISNAFGGLAVAHRRIQDLDVASVAQIIRLAAGLDKSQTETILDGIAHHGIANVVGPVAAYIAALCGGTRE